MKLIPVKATIKEKKPMQSFYKYWSGKPWKGQNAVGVVNGIDGINCLDIDHARLLEINREYLLSRFPCVESVTSGHMHVYFTYIGTSHTFCYKHYFFDGERAGELRLRGSYQVFPSEIYEFSNRYRFINCDLNSFSNLPTLDDTELQELMNILKIELKANKSKECNTKPSPPETSGSDQVSKALTPLCLPSSNYRGTLLDIEEYLPTQWDDNQRTMHRLKIACYRSDNWENRDFYFQQWLDSNCFLKKAKKYYWSKWKGSDKTFNPARLRVFERFDGLVGRCMQEAACKGLRTRQKQVNYVVGNLIPKLKDKDGLFHLGSHSKFFKDHGIHPEEVRRSMKSLIKQHKVRLVDKGWIGMSSRKANTYEITKVQQDGNAAPNTSGSSQDVFG